MTKRCKWVTEEPLYIEYHDNEWGDFSRIKDNQYIFEMLLLEGAQAGLSWITILKRRENYRKAFANFNPEIIQSFDEGKIEELMQDEGIIRNRRKITSAIKNAKVYNQLIDEYGSFYQFLQTIIQEPLPILHRFDTHDDIPAETEQSQALSKALKKRGFSFVGPVICYAFMQAIGIVNDHTKECYLYKEEISCLI